MMNGIITQKIVRNIEDRILDQINTTDNQLLCEQIYEQDMELQNDSMLYCPPYHDGATCWPPILAGRTAHMPCPSSYEGQMYNSNENASKECLEYGNWSSKSNYMPCLLTSDSLILDLTMTLRCIFLMGYSVSIACLCLALIIFYIFKSLKCMRNTIHSHLFIALIIKAFTWSISYIFVEFTDIKQFKGNTKATINSLLNITVSLQAFGALAIFVWMFIEGLYLCLIVYCAFWVDKMKFWPYALFGWGLPTLLISIRGVLNFIKYPTEFWLFHGTDVYLLTIPTLILLGLNVLFLIAILYALNDKLRKRVIIANANISSNNNDTNSCRRNTIHDTDTQQHHRKSTNLFTDPYENYTSMDDVSDLQPLPNFDDYHLAGYIAPLNKCNSYYPHQSTHSKSLLLRHKSNSETGETTMNEMYRSRHQDTTNISSRSRSDNNNNGDNSEGKQLPISHPKRRFQSLPNTSPSPSSSSAILSGVSNQRRHYQQRQLHDENDFYQKSNLSSVPPPSSLSASFMHRISRDASCRSSQISDISRFELPGTTRIRLTKLIGRISGREFVKTVKASLTLMPLLGIPEIIFITPYHPYLKPAFDIINAFLTSTQGIWVTLLYCFLTKEVRRQFEKQLRTRSLRTSLRPHRRSTRLNKRLSA
ncbi:unnamed protein product [Heterobilharzia americana]|nr:unnamed protein product [Heterobilharzia americana]